MQQSAAYKVGNFGKGEVRTDLSRQWIARPSDQRFLSLTDLHASVSARADASVENRVSTRNIEFIAPGNPATIEETHDLSVGLDGGNIAHPTHWSFGQLCTLAKAPAGHYRTLPSQIVADALTYGIRYNREAEQVKLYRHDEQLLAATGPDYGVAAVSAILAALAAKASTYLVGAGVVIAAFVATYLRGRSAGKQSAETRQKAKEAEARANEIDRIKRAAGAAPVGMPDDEYNRDRKS
ncbi:hypothetical protein [Mesorhizobium sp. 8]|uniref:hypothetical protein n=1 Tax=Mesorhizobium sp. 8 TaxID=2584466 RepID=UPI00111E0C8E|nr:hypothetical protein [Mesorhizobium sp. 8]QDC00367.1 hypothetical protein FGU64_08025 [Mesorhizobium sp. 8]